MTEWTMIYWKGPAEAALDELRQFGWRAPGEDPADASDPRIGGFIPPVGQPLVTMEGTAFVAVVANGPIETPAGLTAADPGEARDIIGSF